MFSLVPDGSAHLQPNYVSQRYGKLVKRLGIETSIHKLRHYSATELIAAGVDVRTVAGRLGHGGGGTTTLRTYAAWVSESDQRAATNLATRMPTRPEAAVLPPVDETDSGAPYLLIAAAIRNAIECGSIRRGSLLPGIKQIAARYGVSVGTAHRAVSVLVGDDHLEVQPRRGIRVLGVDAPAAALGAPVPVEPTSPTATSDREAEGPTFLRLEVRRQRQVLGRLMAEADPRDPAVLKRLLLDRTAPRRRACRGCCRLRDGYPGRGGSAPRNLRRRVLLIARADVRFATTVPRGRRASRPSMSVQR